MLHVACYRHVTPEDGDMVRKAGRYVINLTRLAVADTFFFSLILASHPLPR